MTKKKEQLLYYQHVVAEQGADQTALHECAG